MKEPKITVVATDALLRQLLLADGALRASRSPRMRQPCPELQDLIVRVTTARGNLRDGNAPG